MARGREKKAENEQLEEEEEERESRGKGQESDPVSRRMEARLDDGDGDEIRKDAQRFG